MDISAFSKVSYGLYLVSSREGDNLNGHISNTVFQVTADPPKFVVASHKENLTTRYIEKSGIFSVSVLQQNVDLEFIGPWGFKSGTSINKFKNVRYRIGKSGAPIVLEKALAFIDCQVVDKIDTGTHILFVGLVVDAGILDESATPLTYDYYRERIKGHSPEHAPTFTGGKPGQVIPDPQPQQSMKKKKYQCKICGYIYDPENGDPYDGIPPGTAFEDIPDDWCCPICGVSKKDFYPID